MKSQEAAPGDVLTSLVLLNRSDKLGCDHSSRRLMRELAEENRGSSAAASQCHLEVLLDSSGKCHTLSFERYNEDGARSIAGKAVDAHAKPTSRVNILSGV